jgi:hypothetical protein
MHWLRWLGRDPALGGNGQDCAAGVVVWWQCVVLAATDANNKGRGPPGRDLVVARFYPGCAAVAKTRYKPTAPPGVVVG